jgi:acetyltransferase-like isoleucine patch superfamily enzyme
MHYCVLAASDEITVGRLTQIAEHSSIRDSDHGTMIGRPIQDQLTCAPVHVGQDVWIGRGSAILKGSTIGDGAVIGANSVVKGDVAELSIAVGAPARVLRRRNAVFGTRAAT